MNDIGWHSVAKEFAFDGSLRDVCVFEVDLPAWQRALDAMRQTRYELVFYRAGAVTALPTAAADAFPAERDADRMLSVRFAGIQANCHFFTPDEIEFDVDPREIDRQDRLDALLAFMRLLSDATGRDAVLTPEGCPAIVVFRTRPGESAVEYHEFGGWSAAE